MLTHVCGQNGHEIQTGYLEEWWVGVSCFVRTHVADVCSNVRTPINMLVKKAWIMSTFVLRSCVLLVSNFYFSCNFYLFFHPMWVMNWNLFSNKLYRKSLCQSAVLCEFISSWLYYINVVCGKNAMSFYSYFIYF